MGSIMVFRSYNSRTHGVCNKPDIATDTASMADKTPKEQSEAAFAKRIDPTKEDLSNEQTYFIRQVELAQWKKKTSHLRGRNVATGLAIGAMVMGICILT